MDSNSSVSYVFQGLLFILGFSSILFLAYITTRLLAFRVGNTMKGKYISIVETINIGTDKKLYLVKVDETFILLSSSGKSFDFISVVPIKNYEGNTVPHKADFKSSISFKDTLGKLKSIIGNTNRQKEKDRDA
jgi:flagellar biogenesis protein FliO